jgi:hypothetical protein
LQRYPIILPSNPNLSKIPNRTLSNQITKTHLPTQTAQKEDFVFYQPQPFTIQNGVIFYKIITVQSELNYILRYCNQHNLSMDY